MDIDIYYQEIVHSLLRASEHHKIPIAALKHYWSAALDDPKQSCIQMHELWVNLLVNLAQVKYLSVKRMLNININKI